MKRILPLALFAPTSALAHPGDHGVFSPWAMLAHLVSEPDHIALIVAVAVAGFVLVVRSRSLK
jgi:hypothetical protein